MSRMSKADEATSWRRPMPSNDHHSKQSSSSSYNTRPASAGGSSAYGRHQQQQPTMQQQPRQPVPTTFNVVEAQALLEQRWSSLCQQGLKPSCQCKAEQSAAAAADGKEERFLQALKSAADSKTADAAWDDG